MNVSGDHCGACGEETEALEWDEDYEVYVCEDCYQSPPE